MAETPDQIAEVIRSTAKHDGGSSDAKAEREQKKLFGDEKRGEQLKVCVHWVTVIAVVILGLSIVLVLVVRITHMMLPTSKQWLSTEQINAIDKFMSSGVVGGILTKGASNLAGKKTTRKRN